MSNLLQFETANGIVDSLRTLLYEDNYLKPWSNEYLLVKLLTKSFQSYICLTNVLLLFACFTAVLFSTRWRYNKIDKYQISLSDDSLQPISGQFVLHKAAKQRLYNVPTALFGYISDGEHFDFKQHKLLSLDRQPLNQSNLISHVP